MDWGHIKKIILIIIIAYVGLLIFGSIIGMVISPLFSPSMASIGDSAVIDVGQDDFLKINWKDHLVINEENIPDGSASTTIEKQHEIKWFNARNITCIDLVGKKTSIIVWKAPADNYNFKQNINQNQYERGYLIGPFRHCTYFLEYNYQTKEVYGVIIKADGVDADELTHDILGFDFSVIPPEEGYSDDEEYSENYGGVI